MEWGPGDPCHASISSALYGVQGGLRRGVGGARVVLGHQGASGLWLCKGCASISILYRLQRLKSKVVALLIDRVLWKTCVFIFYVYGWTKEKTWDLVNKKERKPSTKWKDSLWIGRKYLEQCIWQGMNFQIIQTTHTILYQKNKNKPVKKWTEALNRYFSKEDIQLANVHLTRRSTWLIIEKANENYNEAYLTPVRMGMIKKSVNNKCWRGFGENGTFLRCWWKCESYRSYGELHGGSLTA